MVSTLLELPTVRERALPITVEQYHALGSQGLIAEKVELLDGLIVEKMPKSPLHSVLVLLLAEWLRRAVGAGFHVRVEQPITCLHSEPEPDLAVVRGAIQGYMLAHPATAELVIEVAVSSVEIDRRKRAIYAAAGVREYWIVLPEDRQIEVFDSLVEAEYTNHRVYSDGQTALSAIVPNFQVKLAELFPN